jgi:hypothetical protein
MVCCWLEVARIVLIVLLVCVSEAHTSWRLNDPRFALVRFYLSAYGDLRSAVVYV